MGIAMVATLALVHFVWPAYSIINFAYYHPMILVQYLLAYVGVGIVWSFFKWYLFLIDARDDTRERLNNIGKTKIVIVVPSASNNKARITSWTAFWPWTVTWWIINDPIKRFYRWLFRVLSSTYDGVANRMFKEFQ